ncbi:MAG: L,D-transpeptidase [Pseudanabaena sp. ELA607]|jgi:lipoprotein-anchoring transpeptidase ErfK/SrfK
MFFQNIIRLVHKGFSKSFSTTYLEASHHQRYKCYGKDKSRYQLASKLSWFTIAMISGILLITDLNPPATLAQSNSSLTKLQNRSTPKPNRNNSNSINNNANHNFQSVITQMKRSKRRWIEVRIRSQRLYAWEGDRLAFRSNVSAGKSNSPTPTGLFTIQSKHNTAPMSGEGYNIPDVPFVMYYDGNYAIHGAYWHRKFGVPVSRGCINLDPDQAARLFRWTDVGTPIVIRE